jgi:hypothetical protein
VQAVFTAEIADISEQNKNANFSVLIPALVAMNKALMNDRAVFQSRGEFSWNSLARGLSKVGERKFREELQRKIGSQRTVNTCKRRLD